MASRLSIFGGRFEMMRILGVRSFGPISILKKPSRPETGIFWNRRTLAICHTNIPGRKELHAASSSASIIGRHATISMRAMAHPHGSIIGEALAHKTTLRRGAVFHDRTSSVFRPLKIRLTCGCLIQIASYSWGICCSPFHLELYQNGSLKSRYLEAEKEHHEEV